MTSAPGDAGVKTWDATYRNAGQARLWPPDPTVATLDLTAWRERGLHTVLDAGCGDGKNLIYLAKNGFFVIGADASASALEKSRYYINDQGLRGSSLLLAPTLLDRLPLLDETIDAVVCVDVLGHLEEPGPVLRELGRVLRHGALLYASIFDIEDGCRAGPRMRAGVNQGEFWYHSSGQVDVEYYFRFYEESAARELFQTSGMRLESLNAHCWQEPPHPGYRDEPHQHRSWFALLRKD